MFDGREIVNIQCNYIQKLSLKKSNIGDFGNPPHCLFTPLTWAPKLQHCRFIVALGLPWSSIRAYPLFLGSHFGVASKGLS